MFTAAVRTRSLTTPIRFALIVALCLIALPAIAQKGRTNDNKIERPAWQGYHEITLGSTADFVREKMGAPKTEDSESIFYMVSDLETAQFLLDADGKVRAISVIFEADHTAAPTVVDVFGKTAAVEPRPDGGLFKMVRYEELGFWISYNRMAGEKAMVIVLMQKF